MSSGQRLKEAMDKALPATVSESLLNGTTDRSFKDIELTEDEIEEALRAGRETKHYRLVREDYSRKLREEPQYLRFTAEQLFERYSAILNEDGQPFGSCMSPAFEKIVKWICLYFAADPRFEEKRPDL